MMSESRDDSKLEQPESPAAVAEPIVKIESVSDSEPASPDIPQNVLEDAGLELAIKLSTQEVPAAQPSVP